MTYSRTLVLKEYVYPKCRVLQRLTLDRALGSGYQTNIPDDDPRIVALSPPLDQQIRTKAKELFVEDELGKRR